MKIAVYCGASLGAHPSYEESAKQLGRFLANRGHTLVYGGGKVGLMGVLADAVLENGGEVIGIIPTFLVERELSHPNVTHLEEVATMSERKNRMIELAECYIALPGGPGTLEEITEVISWARIGQNNHPSIILNVNGYYDLLEQFFDQMVETQFLDTAGRKAVLFTSELEELDTFIQNYNGMAVRKY
jgi:uncharacterized protein (TIGR00730 family)